ncbi:homeodomain-interacting protein kinase 3-like [Tautogolabrus adspersus]
MLRFLMRHKMDKFNIVKFYCEVVEKCRRSLVFEVLDISLQDYLVEIDGPMTIKDIRSIIKQMAVALSGLKKFGVIHTDVKLDNIMMVDHKKHPFKVKLIDFGLAIFKSQAKPGWAHQVPCYRAPEIILGLPFSEAVDIWSLGCVMAIMMLGFMLFPGRIEYDTLRFIKDLLGPPPVRLLNAGQKSKVYFIRTDSDQWILKTLEEYWGPTVYSTDNRFYTFRSVDEMTKICLENCNKRETVERRECIDLLKAMLMWDRNERIIPTDILNHPFITLSYLDRRSHLRSCDEPSGSATFKPNTSQAKERTLCDDSSDKTLSSNVIMVRPADPRNTLDLEDSSEEDNKTSVHLNAAAAVALGATRTQQDITRIEPDCTDLPFNYTGMTKNYIFSWMKSNLCSCCNTDDVKE